MAKSATISKNTKSKKQNKKPSKIGNFLSKLNPNTPKKKLLTFALVFAIAGGGYYAYRSFAATTATWVYTYDNGGLRPYSKGQNCLYKPVKSAEKNNATVTFLQCWGLYSNSGQSGIYDTNAYIVPWLVNNDFRACITGRLDDNFKHFSDIKIEFAHGGKVLEIKRFDLGRKYSTECTGWHWIESTGDVSIRAYLHPSDNTDQRVYISSMSLQMTHY